MIRKLFSCLILIALFLGSTACNLVITPEPAPGSAPESTVASAPELNPNGVIFTPEQSATAIDVMGRSIEETWAPTAADVAKLEAGISAFLQTAENPWLREDPPIWEREPNYMRQYLGIVEDGKQIIYANFFCRDDNNNWREEFMFVMDGGDCYFQLKFDPASNEFLDLYVNGES